MTMELEKLSKNQLTVIAKELRIMNYSTVNKSQQIQLLDWVEIKTISEHAPHPSN